MNKNTTIALLMSSLLVTACHKKPKDEVPPPVPAVASAPDAAAAPAAAAPAAAAADPEKAEKQSKLDYAVMEDGYINDAKAQWATGAKASSTFGDEDGKTPSDGNLASNIAGPADGKDWTNNKQDMGFDSVVLTYAKPVSATEVRLVLPSGSGVEAINKVELQDTTGKWNTVWTGVSDVKKDDRGNRTWFVRKFDKTPYKAQAVKVTIANNLQHDYKRIDAVQLVGE
ncbi:hypothetical protein HSX11_08940 [Oxalobacteraceae bacterium]|nr:hypothetical protein [Oxalobacteraceae bacterium]